MKHRLRADKTCLNCRRVVPERFCTHCGQENVQPRKPFYYLFTHFVEDLVHYDSSFYKTVKSLLFRPGGLTLEYLSGRRKTYVPPVKLYIFINFVTFFMVSLFYAGQNSDEDRAPVVAKSSTANLNDTLARKHTPAALRLGDYRSLREMDSVEALKPEAQRMTGLKYWYTRKVARAQEKYTVEQLQERFYEKFMATVPKAIFLYLPVFAFVLWVFQSKKRWLYYDHGVFTLHYFSFLLLTFSILATVEELTDFSDLISDWMWLPWVLLLGYWVFYFFRAHRRVYRESKLVSRTKSLAMFVVNLSLIVIFIVGVLLYSAIILD